MVSRKVVYRYSVYVEQADIVLRKLRLQDILIECGIPQFISDILAGEEEFSSGVQEVCQSRPFI